MNLELFIKSAVVWVVILVLAIVNGVLRETILTPKMGQVSGLTTSGIILSFTVICVAYLTLPWLGSNEVKPLVAIGLCWLIFTVAFEFLFGLLQGKSFSLLLHAYYFKDGNIWPIVLLTTAAAPYIASKLKALS